MILDRQGDSGMDKRAQAVAMMICCISSDSRCLLPDQRPPTWRQAAAWRKRAPGRSAIGGR